MKLSFETFLNINQTQSAEYIAKFVDKKMKGEKGLSEADTESILDKVYKCFI